jgi:cell division septum initiation protein DivIVA
MDVYDRLNQLTATVRGAKTMPMSASCLVNRAEMLEVLERLRDELPTTLNHADALLSDRQAVLAAGREQAERIVEGARGERERLIQQTEVLVVAQERAAALTKDARAESARLLADADDYVDRKLAEFEVLLGQLTLQLNNGRLRLTTRREADLARFQEASQGKESSNVSASVSAGDGHPGQAAGSASPSDAERVERERPATAGVALGA